MTLQRRLVAVMALMLVIGLVVADVVTYASVRSFLYGRADATLGQDEALAFNYLNFSSSRGLPVDEASLSRRVSTDVYVILLNSNRQVVMRRPSGPPSNPDPSPDPDQGHPGPARAPSSTTGGWGRALRRDLPARPRCGRAGQHRRPRRRVPGHRRQRAPGHPDHRRCR